MMWKMESVCASQWCAWEDSVDRVPFLLAFHAASNPKCKLHWIALKEVPGVVAKIGNRAGRRVKDSDGQWVAPAHTSHGGKVRGRSRNSNSTSHNYYYYHMGIMDILDGLHNLLNHGIMNIIWTSWTSSI
jgi:hypothetical protein